MAWLLPAAAGLADVGCFGKRVVVIDARAASPSPLGTVDADAIWDLDQVANAAGVGQAEGGPAPRYSAGGSTRGGGVGLRNRARAGLAMAVCSRPEPVTAR